MGETDRERGGEGEKERLAVRQSNMMFLGALRFTFITKHILYASKVLPAPPFAPSSPAYMEYICTYLGLSVDEHIFLTCQSSCSNRKAFKLLPRGAAQRRRVGRVRGGE